MMEVFRRLLLVFGLAAGIFAWLAARPIVVGVGVADFVADKARAEDRPTGFMHRDKTLEEFHRTRTEDRILTVSGAKWTEFHEMIRAAAIDGQGDDELLSRRGSGYRTDDLFFLPGDSRVAAAFEEFGGHPVFLYVAVDGVGGAQSPTFTLNSFEGTDVAGDAPAWLVYPFRFLAPWLLVVGLGGYVLLPRPRRREGVIRYSRMSAIVMPDVLATMLFVVFFGLPLLVMGEWGGSLLEFSGAWIPGLVVWILLLAPLVIYAITAKNESFSAEIDESTIRLRTWGGRTAIPLTEVDSLRAVAWRTPGWLRALGWLSILISWRAIVPAATLEQGQGSGIEIVRKNGAPVRIWLAGLPGWKRFVSALAKTGADVEEEVWELVAGDTE